MKNRRRLGIVYEVRVADYLRQKGYLVLEQNFSCRFGEIDLICKKEDCLVFVEVKYRGGSCYGAPAEAVNAEKRRRICNTASYYLYKHHLPMTTPCRFDVAAVSGQSIQVIENAFPYTGAFGG